MNWHDVTNFWLSYCNVCKCCKLVFMAASDWDGAVSLDGMFVCMCRQVLACVLCYAGQEEPDCWDESEEHHFGQVWPRLWGQFIIHFTNWTYICCFRFSCYANDSSIALYHTFCSFTLFQKLCSVMYIFLSSLRHLAVHHTLYVAIDCTLQN